MWHTGPALRDQGATLRSLCGCCRGAIAFRQRVARASARPSSSAPRVPAKTTVMRVQADPTRAG